MILLIILVFITGILTFLAPCTLPVLPAYLAFSAQQSRTSTLARTTFFGLGVALVFLLLGLLAGTLGYFIGTHKDLIARISGIIFILLAVLVFTGKGIPGFQISAKPSRTLAGSFLFGIIFALSWSGCIGPVLGFVLILAANTHTALGGAALLLVYAAGLLLPLLIVSAFLDKLPRNGKLWRLLRGTIVRIAGHEVQTTNLVTAIMLFVLGMIFLLRLDALLGQSSLINRVFGWEERLAGILNITLPS
jgi:cytochrome c-type biogenesis protein